jgi:hypothetical protein
VKSKISAEQSAQMVAERRGSPRFFFLSRADIKVPGHLDTYWGSVLDISCTGLSLQIRQNLQLNTRVLVNLHFMGEQQRESVEMVTAQVIWKSGERTGLKFESPLTESSLIAQRIPGLMEQIQRRL